MLLRRYETIRDETIRYDTIRDDTIRYDTIRYDTIRYETIRDDTRRYETIRYDTIRYETIRDDTRRYETIRDDTRRYETIRDDTRRYEVVSRMNTYLHVEIVQVDEHVPRHLPNRSVRYCGEDGAAQLGSGRSSSSRCTVSHHNGERRYEQ